MSLFADEPTLPGVSDAAPGGAPAPASRVLARKYRPTDFADLIGQDVMVRTCAMLSASTGWRTRCMLTGVRGVGKTTTARIVARALNCVGADGTAAPPPTLRRLPKYRHPRQPTPGRDRDGRRQSRTGVDDVREIIEATRFRPMQARRSVFVIDEVHMLTQATRSMRC